MAGISGVSYSLDDTPVLLRCPVEAVGTGFTVMSSTGALPPPESCFDKDSFFVEDNGVGQKDDVDDEDDLDSDDDDDLEDEDFFDEEDDFLDDDDLDDDDDDDEAEEEVVSEINAPRRPACHRVG